LLTKIQELTKNNNFNIIPLRDVVYDVSNKEYRKISLIKKEAYIDTKYDLENVSYLNYDVKYFGFVCGKKHDLSVIRLKTPEAVALIEEVTGMRITDLSNYIVQTRYGFDLYYKYSKDITYKQELSKCGIEIISDNEIVFLNECIRMCYTIKTDTIDEVPLAIIDLFNKPDDEIQELIVPIYSSIYSKPLANTIQCFVDKPYYRAKPMIKKLICYGHLHNAKLEAYEDIGIKKELAYRFATILANNPTVSKSLFEEAVYLMCEKWLKLNVFDISNEYIQPFISCKPTYDEVLNISLIRFVYDEGWEAKRALRSNSIGYINEEYSCWMISDRNNPYVLYNATRDTYETLSLTSFRQKIYALNTRYAINNMPIMQQLVHTFNPSKPRFFSEHGIEYFNTYKDTMYIKHFRECRPNKDYNGIIGKIIENVIINKEMRQAFMHNIAYLLTHFKTPMTSQIVIDELGGTGKGLLFGEVMGMIFGEYHSIQSIRQVCSKKATSNKLFIYVDEASSTSSMKHALEDLKKVVGNHRVNGGVNFAYIVMSSNNINNFKVCGASDRRFNVTMTSTPLAEQEWFLDIQNNLMEMLELDIFPFMEYLKSIPLSDKIYYTNIKTDFIEYASKATFDNFLDLLHKSFKEERIDPAIYKYLENNSRILLNECIDRKIPLKYELFTKGIRKQVVKMESSDFMQSFIDSGFIIAQYMLPRLHRNDPIQWIIPPFVTKAKLTRQKSTKKHSRKRTTN